MWKLADQDLNPSGRCNLYCSFGNPRSFNPLCWGWGWDPCLLGDLRCRSQILNPLRHIRNSYFILRFRFAHSMKKFSGQGLNPNHSCKNIKSLSTRELFFWFMCFVILIRNKNGLICFG